MTTVDVYLRERTPPSVCETIRDTLGRLRALDRSGAIAALNVRRWECSTEEVGGELDDAETAMTFEEFHDWAQREGYSLRPAFDRREVSSMFCEDSHVRHVVPIVSVAVYADDELQCVAPCTDDDRSYSVHDCIDALESDAERSDELGVANGPLMRAGQS